MPQAVSRKQWRLMMAIMHSKNVKAGPRGVPPKSIASKYTKPGEGAPESKDNNRGGTWTEAHHARAKEKSKKERIERKKAKAKLHKAFDAYTRRLHHHGVGVIVFNSQNQILMGDHADFDFDKLATPGGHIEPGETPELAALRELHEETGLIGHNPIKLFTQDTDGKSSVTFMVESYKGDPKSSKELKNLRWVEPQDIDWSKVRPCCIPQLKYFITTKLGKSLKGMVALENLEKTLEIPEFDITPLDAAKLVGNGVFRILREQLSGIGDEDFRDIPFDAHVVRVRKHIDGTYSGQVLDGHKAIFSFTNKSLPKLATELMSLFEWYVPADEEDLMVLDEATLPDEAIVGGLDKLVENYKRHNLGNIYEEMEIIREQMRNGMAVDLQQVEARVMKLFDKLEDIINNLGSKHDILTSAVGSDIDEIEKKLRDLQNKVEEMEKRPEKIEAYSSHPANHNKVLNDFYPYLSRPNIDIMPNGKISISFGGDWQNLEKENFLKDMRAKVISKSKT